MSLLQAAAVFALLATAASQTVEQTTSWNNYANPMDTRPNTCQAGYSLSKWGSFCYKYYSNKVYQGVAKDTCQRDGAHLIDWTLAKRTDVFNTLTDMAYRASVRNAGPLFVWSGAENHGSTGKHGTWRWSDGTTAVPHYILASGGATDATLDTYNTGAFHVTYTPNGHSNYKVEFRPASSTQNIAVPFICQYNPKNREDEQDEIDD